MLTEHAEDKLGRYRLLLDLALAQIDAIDSRDQKKLNLIMEKKWLVIRSLSGTKELLKTDPLLATIISRIREADKVAEQKLTERMGDVRSKLYQKNQATAARHIYAQTGRKQHPILGLAIDDHTPRFLDVQS